MPGILTMLPNTVSAASADGERQPASPIKRDELSLYTEPQPKFKSAESEASELEQSVASLRKSVQPYAAWCQGAYDTIQPGVQRVIDLGRDTYSYSRSHPKDFYPRAVVIGLTGALGLYHARGSVIKKLVYPAGLMALSASLYYPKQAAAAAKSAGERVYDYAVQSYVAVEKVLKPAQK